MSNLFIVSTVFVTLCASACTGPDPDAGLILQDEQADTGKADGVVRPLGTYFSSGSADYLDQLRLESDHTYYWSNPVDAETGTYHFAKSGDHRYVVLDMDGATVTVSHYEYRLSGASLEVRQTHQTAWETMAHAGKRGENCDSDLDTSLPFCEAGLRCDRNEGCVPASK